MAEETAATVLKILNGVQSGVDVALPAGSYTLGSGDDDDIQVFDVSLKPGHAKLAIKPGKIEIAGGSGQLRTRNGLVLEAGGEFQELEQLDVVSAGTTRFALGARTANWASITDEDSDAAAEAQRAAAAARARAKPASSLPGWLAWRSLAPVAVVLALAGAGAFAVPYLGSGGVRGADALPADELDSVREAVRAFDFGRGLSVTQEVDGAIFVTGFVDTPVERRAVVGAVKELNLPVRVRVAVRDVIRDDVASLIDAGGYDLSYDLSPSGALTLSGVLLDPNQASALVDLIRDRVVGPTSVDSKIRTAPTLLADAKRLAERSQIAPLVLLRLDGTDLLEVSGVIPTEKIDAWVGFLQAYSNQFADLIPLRSLVRLQNPDGSIGEPGAPPPKPLYLGNGDEVAGNEAVDVERLRSGKFELADVFVGQKPGSGNTAGDELAGEGGGAEDAEGRSADAGSNARTAGGQGGAESADARAAAKDGARNRMDLAGMLVSGAGGAASGRAGDASGAASGEAGVERAAIARPVRVVGDGSAWTPEARTVAETTLVAAEGLRPEEGAEDSLQPRDRTGAAESVQAVGEGGLWSRAAQTASAGLGPIAAAADAGKEDALAVMAQELIRRWGDDALGETETGRELKAGMDALEQRRVGSLASSPEALADRYAVLLSRGPLPTEDACWTGSGLTRRSVAGALFWLDLFSVSKTLSVYDLSPEMQNGVLEAALSPRRASACALASENGPANSVYLAEVSRNAAFVDFITRDLNAFPIDIAGVNLTGDRYVQTRNGQKMREGYAPDETSRLAVIGELGVAVERSTGYETGIFGPDLNWVTQ